MLAHAARAGRAQAKMLWTVDPGLISALDPAKSAGSIVYPFAARPRTQIVQPNSWRALGRHLAARASATLRAIKRDNTALALGTDAGRDNGRFHPDVFQGVQMRDMP